MEGVAVFCWRSIKKLLVKWQELKKRLYIISDRIVSIEATIIVKTKIPYALYEGQLIDVYHPEVKRGTNENCICPDKNCNQQLSARKGEKNRHHFYHQNKNACTGLETSLHLKAKNIIEKLDVMKLPSFEVPVKELFRSFKDDLLQMNEEYGVELYTKEFEGFLVEKLIRENFSYQLFSSRNINLKNYEVELEYFMSDMIPDVKLTHLETGKFFYIEIGVTSLISEEKSEIIKDRNLFVLEYDFSRFYRSKYNTEEKGLLENILQSYFQNHFDLNSINYEVRSRLKVRWINIPNLKDRIEYSGQLKTQFLCDIRKFYSLYKDMKILLDRWGRGGIGSFSIIDMEYLDNYKAYKDCVTIKDHKLIQYFNEVYVGNI